MAIVTASNSTSPNVVKWASTDQDPYDRATQLAGLAENHDLHDHSSGKNLPVARVNATEVVTVSHSTTGDSATLTNTNAGALGVQITTYHNSASPATNDSLLNVVVQGEDSVGTQTTYGQLTHFIQDPTDTSEDSYWRFQAMAASTLVTTAVFAPWGATQLVGASLQVTTTASGALPVYLGDTANANNTFGLTVNQGAADDEALSLKSSDVAHGVTDVTETDTYGGFRKSSVTDGGLRVRGLASGTTAGVTAIGTVTTASTTKTTAGSGAVILEGRLKSGTGEASLGADGNILVVRDNGTTRFILDVEGSAHADVEWTTFDTHDDVALLDSLEHALDPTLARDPVRDAFGAVLRYNRDALEAAGIVRFYDDGPRAMVNTTRLLMLLTGATRQLHDRVASQTARIAGLETQLALREG